MLKRLRVLRAGLGLCAAALLSALAPQRVSAVGPDEFYGMHLSYADNTTAAIPKLHDLGVRWVRVWFNVGDWAVPANNTGNAITQAVALKAQGFNVIFHVNTLNGVVPTYSQSVALYNHLKAQNGLLAAVDIWEIFNELNNVAYWNPAVPADGPALYVDGPLKAAWDTLAVPSGGLEEILGASWTAWQRNTSWTSTSRSWNTWETAQYMAYRNPSNKGYRDYAHYAGMHPYTDTVAQQQTIMTSALGLFGSTPCIVSEWGFKVNGKTPTQYMALLDQNRQWMYDHVVTACYYRFSPGNGWPGACTYSSPNYVAAQPVYDTYKNWPKVALAPISVNPVADSHVDQANSGTNYGTNAVLETYKTTTTEKATYLRFDLSSYGATATSSATLTLKRYTADSGITVGVYYGADDSWTESGVTWSNRPATNSSATNTLAVSTTVTFDITSAVNTALAGDKILTLRLANAGGTGRAAFYSRNHSTVANRPLLTVNP